MGCALLAVERSPQRYYHDRQAMGLISARKLRLELSTSRIEALTDGIFAIAMTLLVLNIEVSEPRQGFGAYEFRQRVLNL